MTIIIGLLIALLSIAGSLAVYRVFSGPSNLDRVLALDYLSIVGIGMVIILVLVTNEPMILDLGMCLAFVGFLTAYIFSKFAPKEKK